MNLFWLSSALIIERAFVFTKVSGFFIFSRHVTRGGRGGA